MVALLRVMARASARRIGGSRLRLPSASSPPDRSASCTRPRGPDPAIRREIDAVLGGELARDRRAADAPAGACCDGDVFDG